MTDFPPAPHLVYVSPRDILKARSDPIHIVASCRAFVRQGTRVELVAPGYERPENISEDDVARNYGIAPHERFDILHLPTRLRDDDPPWKVRTKKLFHFSRHAAKRILFNGGAKASGSLIVYGKCLVSILPYIHLSRLRRRRRPVIGFEAASFVGTAQERYVLRRCDRIIAINPLLKEDIVAATGIDPERILVPPLGVDDAFAEVFTMEKEQLRRELGVSQEAFVALYAGKLSPESVTSPTPEHSFAR